jgi:hypothetical protein
MPDRRSKGGTRYYDVGKILGLGNEDMPTCVSASGEWC